LAGSAIISLMSLQVKTALVTGASIGIGRAIAIELAKEGVKVFITARRRQELEKTKNMIESQGGQAELVAADLGKISSINSLISTLKRKTQELNILVNVAGIWHGKTQVYAGKNFETFSQKVILDTFSVGTIAPALLAHGLIPIMPKNSKIINISGTFESGAKGWLPYYVSKRAIEDLTLGLAEELKDKGIQINCISPSDTATEQYKKYFPQYIQDAIAPEKIAQYATFLCSAKANNISGEVFVIKKGQKPYSRFHA